MVAGPHALGKNILEAGVGVREASPLLGRQKSNEGNAGIHLAFFFSPLILQLGVHGLVMLHSGWIVPISKSFLKSSSQASTYTCF